MTHPIEVWFLVLSLFLPRISLLIAYLSGQIPPNTIPFIGDLIMTILIPRVLILIYIGTNMGLCAWFWVHLVFAVLVCIKTTSKVSNSKSKN